VSESFLNVRSVEAIFAINVLWHKMVTKLSGVPKGEMWGPQERNIGSPREIHGVPKAEPLGIHCKLDEPTSQSSDGQNTTQVKSD